MDAHIFNIAFGIISYLLVCGVYGREVCQNYGFVYTYCEDGYYCCNNDTDCCANLSTAAIVGIVIGSLFVVAVVIGVCVACINSMSKTRASVGTVVNPGTQMHVISSGYSQPQPGMAGPAYPPYGGQGAGAPSGSYPPPPVPAYTEQKPGPPQ